MDDPRHPKGPEVTTSRRSFLKGALAVAAALFTALPTATKRLFQGALEHQYVRWDGPAPWLRFYGVNINDPATRDEVVRQIRMHLPKRIA